MKAFQIICYLMISVSCFGQGSENLKVPYNNRCGIENTCHDCTDTVARFDGNITKYFSRNINWRILEQITGVILIDIGVDASGRCCIYNIYNHTANENNIILDLRLGSLITAMPAWKPAMKNRQPVSSIRSVAIYSFVKGRSTFDVSYISRDKPIKWQPARELTEVRRTIGTSEVDNSFDPEKVRQNNR
jgi:hypothetical protein